MEFETLIYEPLGDNVARMTLNRPEKLNAMSPQLLGEFDQALDTFEGDRDASVLIIRGAGRLLRRFRHHPAARGQRAR
jgi:enoyl-CoA hydratase